MKTVKINFNEDKSIVSELENNLFRISKIYKLSMDKEVFDDLNSSFKRRSYDPINNRILNYPLSIVEGQEQDLIIHRRINNNNN